MSRTPSRDRSVRQRARAALAMEVRAMTRNTWALGKKMVGKRWNPSSYFPFLPPSLPLPGLLGPLATAPGRLRPFRQLKAPEPPRLRHAAFSRDEFGWGCDVLDPPASTFTMNPTPVRQGTFLRCPGRPAQGAAFLDGACGNDTALRARLDALLAAAGPEVC